MVLPVSMDATWLDGLVQFNGQELRRADSGLFIGEGSQPLGVRGGIVRHNDSSLLVTVNASDVITVQPGAIVIPGNSGVANGVYRAALAAADTGTLTARNATNPRIDLVIFRAMDTSVIGSHAAYTGRVEVLTGTPAASPVVPTLPAMAQELARITVPASGGATATVDLSFREFATAIGGVLPVPSSVRLPAAPNAKWLEAVALDTGREYRWDGTAWDDGGWVPFTPTIIGGFAAGTGASLAGRFIRINRTIHFRLKWILGTGFTIGNGIAFTLPVSANTTAAIPETLSVMSSAGVNNWTGGANIGSTAVAPYIFGTFGAGTAITATAPFTWKATDSISISGTYEAAA